MSEINGSSRIQDGTADGLMQFLDYVVAKGYGTGAAVTPLKSAFKQVVETVEGTEDIGNVDVRGIDIPTYFTRYETLSRGKLKVESVRAYRRRFTGAVEAYLKFIDTGTPPSLGGSTTRRQRAAPAPSAEPQQDPAATPEPRERMIDYPFPLRSGSVATLRLPYKLEKIDSERIAAFVRTLVFDPVLELGSGGRFDGDES